MLGAIANGITTIHGFLDGDDCWATLRAFQSMGVRIEHLRPQQVMIYGVGKHGLKKPEQPIDCGNSGTSMRLLTGLLAAQSFDSELMGDESLSQRPMARVSDPLRLMGADVVAVDNHAPLVIRGGQSLQGIRYAMPTASAQVKSSLLLAGLYAKGETQLIEPSTTRDHTERMLKAFSYPIHQFGNETSINASGHLTGTDIRIPGDLSSAAFFIVAATLIPNSTLVLKNIGVNPTRMGVIHILNRMGANIEISNMRFYNEEPVADLYVRSAELQGVIIPEDWVSLAIDEFPIIFIACACAKGQTILRKAKELRYKESDRIMTMAKGLKSLGIESELYDDGICLQGGSLQGGEVDSHGDHRIAMAFLIAGAVAKTSILVKNCANITTSFPNFLELANEIKLTIQRV